MTKTIQLIVILSIMTSCQNNQGYKPSNLTKVSEKQLINNAKNHQFPDPEKIVFKNLKGEVVSLDSIQQLPNPESLAPDYYQNLSGEIVECVIRKSTEKDDELNKKIEKSYHEGPDVKTVDINCDDKIQILNDVFERDQGMRRDGGKIDPKKDHQNLEIIVSFIEKCGIPTLEEVSDVEMAAIWAVLQHAPARYQSKYIPDLEKAAKRGDIEWGTIALMKDRALMYEGKPQVYGSQVSGDELYDLFEPEYVNQRRAEIGMEPLEDYLKRFEIEFIIEQRTK